MKKRPVNQETGKWEDRPKKREREGIQKEKEKSSFAAERKKGGGLIEEDQRKMPIIGHRD